MKDIYRSKIEYDRFLFSIQEESLKKEKLHFHSNEGIYFKGHLARKSV